MDEQKLKFFFRDALIIAFGVLFAAVILGPGHIEYSGIGLLIVAMFISLLNAFLRPIMISFGVPFLLTTLGLSAGAQRLLNLRSMLGTLALLAFGFVFMLWFINACIFSLASFLAGSSFIVHGFGSAMLGSIFTSFATLMICVFFGIKRESLLSGLLGNHVQFGSGNRSATPPPQQQPRTGTRSRRTRDDDDVIDI